jgi:hypothetical protein
MSIIGNLQVDNWVTFNHCHRNVSAVYMLTYFHRLFWPIKYSIESGRVNWKNPKQLVENVGLKMLTGIKIPSHFY